MLNFLLLRKFLEFSTGVTLSAKILRLLKDTYLTTDGLGGFLVVSSDADNSDTSSLAVCDGATNFGPGGIEHADNGDEGQILFESRVVFGAVRMVMSGVDVRNVGVGESKSTEAF